MSEVKVNKISPRSGTTVTLGDSGDTIDIPSGVTFNNTGGTITGNISVDGGTIKLDGNYPTGSNNVALGDTALDSVQAGGTDNVAIGHHAGTALTIGDRNIAIGSCALKVATLSVPPA